MYYECMNTLTPVALLTQRTISWEDANKLRNNYNLGLHELVETETYAFGGTAFVEGMKLLIIEVSNDTVWMLPLDRESNVLTAQIPTTR